MTNAIKSHVKLHVKFDSHIQDELPKLTTGGRIFFLELKQNKANLLHHNSD